MPIHGPAGFLYVCVSEIFKPLRALCAQPAAENKYRLPISAAWETARRIQTVEKASQSLRSQAQINCKTFLPAACTSAKILLGSQTCERKRVRCGEPQPFQTRAQRSGSRLRACQKYFFDKLHPPRGFPARRIFLFPRRRLPRCGFDGIMRMAGRLVRPALQIQKVRQSE